VNAGPPASTIDQRGEGRLSLDPLTVAEADVLLEAALAAARQRAGVT
jgi:hypothetical protein